MEAKRGLAEVELETRAVSKGPIRQSVSPG